MDHLHKLRVFCEVVRRQSLTHAAEHLLVSQPVVSAHIRDLEKFVGADLLEQRGRRMHLTEAGTLAYQYAQETLRASQDLIDNVRLLRAGESGRLSIGATAGPGTYFLPKKLTAFKRRYPRSELAFHVSDSETLYEQIRTGVYDLAVLAVLDVPWDIHAEVLTQEPLVLIARPEHRLAARSLVQIHDLADEDFICSPVGNTQRSVIEIRLRELGLTSRRLVMTLGHPAAIKQAVLDGIGIALLYRSSIQREVLTGELVEIPVQGVEITHPYYLVHSAGKRFTPLQQHFIELLREA